MLTSKPVIGTTQETELSEVVGQVVYRLYSRRVAQAWHESTEVTKTQMMPSLFCLLVGIEIVRKALRIPCHMIAANAGVDAQEVVTKVMQEQPDVGYDALHATYVDMMKAGIIDPTKVSFHSSHASNTTTLYKLIIYCLTSHFFQE